MGAERDADRFARSETERDPEVVDVCRDGINLGRERDRRAGDVNEVAVLETKVGAFCLPSWSMRQNVKATME